MSPVFQESFVRALFYGVLAEDLIAPYPQMPADDRETTSDHPGIGPPLFFARINRWASRGSFFVACAYVDGADVLQAEARFASP